jgi:anaphase-promoting complex subunit 5
MQTKDKTYYQHALLHMTILQMDFGYITEAIATINETIATARETQDMLCLNYSLSWLNHLRQTYPKEVKAGKYAGLLDSERDAINFLKMKSKEGKMHSLLSTTLLNEAKYELQTVSVLTTFENKQEY